MKKHFLLVLVFALVLALAGCSNSSSGGGAGDINNGNNGNNNHEDNGGPCPDPYVSVAITSPDTTVPEIVIPVGEYTFMATVATTYPNRTEVVWVIDGVEYEDTDVADNISQVTVTFDVEKEIEISVTAKCTATDLRTDTDTDSCVARIGEIDETSSEIEAARGCSGDGFFAVITPITNHLYTWGENTYGQLGLGDTIDRATPQQVLPDLTDKRWYSVAFHGNTAYATDLNGNIWVWGENFTSTPVILDNNMWATVDAGALFVAATNWLDETYLWSDASGAYFDDRVRITKDSPDLKLYSLKMAGSNILCPMIFKDGGGNLSIIDVSDDSGYVPLDLGWNAEDYAIADTDAAFIRDGKLYIVEDVPTCILANYGGVYEFLPPPYTQVGVETDWVRVYSALDGIIAVRGTSPETLKHYFIGDVYPADVYPEFTEIDITTLPEQEQRIVNVAGIPLYIPDGARF